MSKLKGLKKAVGEYKRYNDPVACWRADLMLDTSTGELWTDAFYGINYSWNEYHSDSIINLSSLMKENGDYISMETVKTFCQKHFKIA